MVNRVAVCSWSLQTKTTVELMQAMQACGLSHSQLELDPYIQNEVEYSSLISNITSGQLTICSGMMTTIGEDYSSLERIMLTGGLRPDEHWDANVQRASRCAQLARKLGLGLVTMHAGYIPQNDPALHDTMVERICRIAEIFNDQGVTLGLETGQERSDTLLMLLSTIAARVRVGVNFDPANMILYAMGDPIEAMADLRSHIVQVHMKDAIQTIHPGSWGTEVPVGEGEVDWDAFFRIVHELPQSVDVVIEREAGEQRVADIIAARQLAEDQIARVQA